MGGLAPNPAAQVIPLLRARDGQPTIVETVDGKVLRVFNIAWGQDEGEDWEHVTTNISPALEGASVDFFLTGDVARVVEPETGELLWVR